MSTGGRFLACLQDAESWLACLDGHRGLMQEWLQGSNPRQGKEPYVHPSVLLVEAHLLTPGDL